MNIRDLKKKAERIKPNMVYILDDEDGRFRIHYSSRNYSVFIDRLEFLAPIDNIDASDLSSLLSDIKIEIDHLEETADF